jgi:preprotein translocase subunit SecB
MGDMKPSPLTLRDYFVTDLSFSVNRSFDPKKPPSMRLDDLIIKRELSPRGDNPLHWSLTLRIQHQTSPDQNTPYSLALEMVGHIDIIEGFPEEKRHLMLEINGASMLYGAAREIIRSVTSRGPFFQTVLPSVSFYPKKDTPPPNAGCENKP